MTKNKLFSFFLALERGEYRWFRDFIASPYFNKNDEVARLGNVYLDLAARDFPDSATDPKRIFKAAFPHLPYDEKRLIYLSSDLLRLGEQFLAQRAYEADETAADLYRLNACRQRKLEKSYRNNLGKLEKKWSGSDRLTLASLYQKFQFSLIQELHFAEQGERIASPFLQQTVDELDHFYFANKLRLSNAMLSTELTLNHTFDFRFVEADYLSRISELPEHRLAALYATSFALLKTTNREDLLLGFLAQIRKNVEQLAPEDIRELFYHGINYCVRQIRIGHRKFADSLLVLYQTGLEDGFLIEDDGYLSPWNYKNIVKLGLSLRKFDWVESVVANYTDSLAPDSRSDARHFNLADLAYYRRNFSQAQHHLRQTEFTDIHYALGAKSMLLKIYYETAAEEALLSLLFSFRLFLIRNKLVGQATKDAYLNFIRLLKKLVSTVGLQKLQKVLNSVNTTTNLSDRSWLLKKVEEKIDSPC